MSAASGAERPQVSFFNDPRTRSIAVQALLVIALFWFGWYIVDNTIHNLNKSNIASGYGFLSTTAGFDISMSLVPYSRSATYGQAILVGLINTILIAILGVIAATILGFLVGIMKLSHNWVIAKLATIYVEFVRNTPLLLQIFIWYSAVLKPLPSPRQAGELGLPYPSWGLVLFLPLLAAGLYVLARGYKVLHDMVWARLALTLGFGVWTVLTWRLIDGLGLHPMNYVKMGFFLSNRGAIAPKPIFADGAIYIFYAFIVALILAWVIRRWAIKRQEATGEQFPHVLTGIGLIVVLPVLAFFLAGSPVSLDYPALEGFNFKGGMTLVPEFIALFLALTIYTAGFIAEIVRAGIVAVSHGQTEAAGALGLRPGLTTRLVIIPQALRVIIPPLTSEWLNLTKNSSLAVAIGFPDLVATGGTVLNQTGQAIEVIVIWMTVYLGLSLLTSAFMNWFNARKRLVER